MEAVITPAFLKKGTVVSHHRKNSFSSYPEDMVRLIALYGEKKAFSSSEFKELRKNLFSKKLRKDYLIFQNFKEVVLFLESTRKIIGQYPEVSLTETKNGQFKLEGKDVF